VFLSEGLNHSIFADYTLKTCGCVMYSMPHVLGTKICSARNCTDEKNEEDESDLVDGKVTAEDSNSSQEDFARTECQCFPACSSIKFETDISATKLSKGGLTETLDE
jgi:acid-sensing ion channel, other